MTIISVSRQPSGHDNRPWAGDVYRWLANGRTVKWGTIDLPADLTTATFSSDPVRDSAATRKPGTYVTAEVA